MTTAAGGDPLPRLRAAVLGTGSIGRDLVRRLASSPTLECALAVGRRDSSPGLIEAAARGVAVSSGGVDAVLADDAGFDVVFDATSAESHRRHWPLLREGGALVVDLTPSRIGVMHVPEHGGGLDAAHAVPDDRADDGGRNVNLVSCGGQAAVPIARALARRFRVEYLEAVSTVASRSAGRATRENIDDYVRTTTSALQVLAGVPSTKAALNVSPADPPATFRTAVGAIIPDLDEAALRESLRDVVARMRRTSPGLRLEGVRVVGERALITISVVASGDVLPPWAGNLELIDAAAIATAERLVARRPTRGAVA